MLNQLLNDYRLILGSASPRRKSLLEGMGLSFTKILKPVEETYPTNLTHSDITDFLAKLKAEPFLCDLKDSDVLITSDTIVWHNNEALGKPRTKDEAIEMLCSLSDTSHEVITSICLSSKTKQSVSNAVTTVYFSKLSADEIDYYVNAFHPMDKAGAYGIQEWIGQIGVYKIHGSYENVVGLPTQLLYNQLTDFLLKD